MNIPTLLGKPLSKYRIFCENTSPAAILAAQKLQEWLRAACGAEIAVSPTSDANHIILAPLPHAAYGEGTLCAKEDCVCLQANDIVGLTELAAYLVHILAHATADVTADMLFYHAILPTRESYIENAEAFLPCYRHAHQLSPTALTLAHKREVLHDPAGRPFVIAHRGEHVFYPENSLEGALSAWRGGADAVEVDMQKSADGIWMCMHDTDVTRTTNAEDLLGKQGYPCSPLLCDWTYAQLRTLRLKDAYGTLTPFPIPTLAEILRACDGRIFVHLDKAFSVTEDVFPFMEKLGVYDCVYLVNHIAIADILKEKEHFAHLGVHLESLTRPRARLGQTAKDVIPTLLENLPHVTPAIIPVGDYVAQGAKDWALVAKYREKLRFGAWFLRDFDGEALWREARARGISIFMTDRPLDLISLQL